MICMGPYVGRFAPTPSGPLHLGSLVAALGSFLAARAAHGQWLLRIDDLDGPRVQAGAESAILSQLEAHALVWDGAPRRQSDHQHEYAEALGRLRSKGLVYACRCTRAQLRHRVPPARDEPVYPGTCRGAGHQEDGAALRLNVQGQALGFDDAGAGHLEADTRSEIGDFVVRRRDGQYAYQLACAVDEAAQGITDVVRGADLIASTFRQILVLGHLGLAIPRYRHLPLVLDARGHKLSKQHGAAPLENHHAARNLGAALKLLGQDVPTDAAQMPARELVAAAIRAWDAGRIPRPRDQST